MEGQAVSNPKPMFVVGRLNSESSGVTRIICDLGNALARRGTPVSLYAADCPDMPSAPHLLLPPSKYVSEPGNWLGGLAHSPLLHYTIEHDLPSFDLVHHHSMWMLPNYYASLAAHQNRKPVLFTAHGVLEPWALAQSRWKKLIVGMWWQNRDLKTADCIHVNSKPEIRGVRRFGLRNPVAVIPNGVDLSPLADLPPRSTLAEKFPRLAGKKVLLFLSRLHKKKGLPHLLEAWRHVGKQHKDWHLLIVGPDDGDLADTKARIVWYLLEDNTTLAGAMMGRDKLAALAGADAFVLPSFSEGFSMAVLEAMAVGLPVVITPGCNFPEAIASGGAIEIEPEPFSTEHGLEALLSMTDAQRTEMGQKGKQLIESRYTWDGVAGQMIELYQWLVGGGTPPSFIEK